MTNTNLRAKIRAEREAGKRAVLAKIYASFAPERARELVKHRVLSSTACDDSTLTRD